MKYLMLIMLFSINSHWLLAATRPGALFLLIPPGAKAMSMGTAFTGSWNDPLSFYYNPGAIGFYNKFSFSTVNQGLPPGIGRFIEQGMLALSGKVLYNELVSPEPGWLSALHSDMRYVSSFYVAPFYNIGTAGITFTYLNTGETLVIDETGIYLGSYETYDVATGLSYGRSFFKRLGVGITAKYIYCYLVPDWVYLRMPELVISKGGIGTAWAVDVGALYRIWGFGVGLSLQNFGTGIRYTESGSPDRLPTRIRGGISVEPLVALDSLYSIHNYKILNIPVNDILNITFNYDRAYDPEDPDDTWECSGWEFTILKFLSYRTGSWNLWWRRSTGIGLNLRNIEIDIARYFDYDAYHVQMTFYAVKPPENIRNNKKLNNALIIASSAIAPGGGQFYKGEGIKGSLFLIPSLYLGNLYLSSESDNKNYLALIGLGVLYLVSAAEAISSK
jgi:hypothetical protein